jgi:hypothetical protein
MALTAALIGGAASLGAAGIGALGRSGANPQGQVSAEQLQSAKDQLVAQQVQQALVNKRAIAGSSDSMGNTVSDTIRIRIRGAHS